MPTICVVAGLPGTPEEPVPGEATEGRSGPSLATEVATESWEHPQEGQHSPATVRSVLITVKADSSLRITAVDSRCLRGTKGLK